MKDVFELLVEATVTMANPRRSVQVTGVKRTTCIRGLKNTTLICADGVLRVMTYRGNINDAIPTGSITIIDISEDMAA